MGFPFYVIDMLWKVFSARKQDIKLSLTYLLNLLRKLCNDYKFNINFFETNFYAFFQKFEILISQTPLKCIFKCLYAFEWWSRF